MREVLIAIYCDIHYDNSEKVEADPILFNNREVDLCKECKEGLPIADLEQIISDYGRKPGSPPVKAKKKELFVATEAENLMCPYGCTPSHGTTFASPRGLKMHITRQHGGEMPQ
jgi:hypothetical protein